MVGKEVGISFAHTDWVCALHGFGAGKSVAVTDMPNVFSAAIIMSMGIHPKSAEVGMTNLPYIVCGND
jgi:hypothetical protein